MSPSSVHSSNAAKKEEHDMLASGKSSDKIAAALRADICLGGSASDDMLHEVALAKRFGVSRTPVRQALQRLSYERMISVKSGVGSVVVALDAAKRAEDLLAAVALLEAISKCSSTDPAPRGSVMDAMGIVGLLEMGELGQDQGFFEVRSRFLGMLSEMVSNPILGDAFRAAYWRLIRWSVADFHRDPEPEIDHLKVLVKDTARALANGSVADAMRTVAEVEARRLT